jgi:hypothetical protein
MMANTAKPPDGKGSRPSLLRRLERWLGSWPGMLALVGLVVTIVGVMVQTRSTPDGGPGSTGVPTSTPAPTLIPTTRANGRPASSGPNPTLTIVSPARGDTVSVNDDVRIDAPAVPPGHQVWILVRFVGYPESYPEGYCDPAGGTIYWCKNAQFGDPETPEGAPLEISAVVVDARGADAYRPYQVHGFDSDHPPVTPVTSSPAVEVTRR